jgi:hypothetical protein
MLTMDDIKRMAHGAGLSSSDLRVKQLAKAAYDLGCQHERHQQQQGKKEPNENLSNP